MSSTDHASVFIYYLLINIFYSDYQWSRYWSWIVWISFLIGWLTWIPRKNVLRQKNCFGYLISCLTINTYVLDIRCPSIFFSTIVWSLTLHFWQVVTCMVVTESAPLDAFKLVRELDEIKDYLVHQESGEKQSVFFFHMKGLTWLPPTSFPGLKSLYS